MNKIGIIRRSAEMVEVNNNLKDYDWANNIYRNYDITMDMIHSLCGRILGCGAFRDVFEYNLNPDWVIKLERDGSSNNTAESLLWEEIQGLKGSMAWVKDWFAPILWTSPSKKVIIMQKTERKPHKRKPEKVPNFFCDVKEDNFGWIGNKYVCHDYGFLHRFIKYEKKFRKIEW